MKKFTAETYYGDECSGSIEIEATDISEATEKALGFYHDTGHWFGPLLEQEESLSTREETL